MELIFYGGVIILPSALLEYAICRLSGKLWTGLIVPILAFLVVSLSMELGLLDDGRGFLDLSQLVALLLISAIWIGALIGFVFSLVFKKRPKEPVSKENEGELP